MIKLEITEETPAEVIGAASLFLQNVAEIMLSGKGDRRQKSFAFVNTEEPKVEEPKVEEPKVEEPKVEEPKVEEPRSDHNLKELDARGLPWDRRIHASSKNKLQSGEWRKKRNVSENLVDQVEAELYRRMGVADIEVAEEAAEPTLSAPPPPPPVSDEAECEDVTPRSYSEFLQLMMEICKTDPSFAPRITEIANTCGVSAIPDMAEASANDVGAVYAAVHAAFYERG